MLISPEELAAIRREVGPKVDEGLFAIERRGARTASGSGFTTATPTIIATVAGRQQYVGDLNPEEKMRLGITRQDVKYVMSLDVAADVQAGDVLIAKAPQWEAGKFYQANQRVRPIDTVDEEDVVTESGKIYVCIVGGRSGDTEPEWPTSKGQTETDGTAAWRCEGVYLRYDVLEKKGPSTYGDYISRKVQCNLEQAGKKP